MPIERKPEWIKTRARTGPEFTAMRDRVAGAGLHTVCQEAGCPNIYECWEDREATFLIGGAQCTRRCDFCQIDTGRPEPLDRDEPRPGRRVRGHDGAARTRPSPASPATTSPDEGAWLYAETVRAIHDRNPGCRVEVLIPDFSGHPDLLAEVFAAAPEVLAHNLETVPRIFKRIRPAFRYDRSLDVITQARSAGLVTKSNLILGMGEEIAEVHQALADLRAAGLRPDHHHAVPAAHPAASSGGALGPSGGVRRALAEVAERDGLPRRPERAPGAVLVPRWTAARTGHGRPRPR